MKCGVVTLCAMLSVAAFAQQAPVPVERPGVSHLHVESRLVSIALNVADEHNAPVGGLKMTDFELLEDGKPVPISYFDADATTPLEIVMAIDASGSVWTDERLERDAAKTFVRSILRPTDKIGLMAFSDEVTEVQTFTDDPLTCPTPGLIDTVGVGLPVTVQDSVDDWPAGIELGVAMKLPIAGPVPPPVPLLCVTL